MAQDNHITGSQPLGTPLPNCTHAVSVSLPQWQDVVDYEEKNPRVINVLKAGYPRFLYHPITAQFFEQCQQRFAQEEEYCIAVPSREAALLYQDYIQKQTGGTVRLELWDDSDVTVILAPRALAGDLKTFWQHSGLIISSRQAEALLNDIHCTPAEKEKILIRQRIADLSGQSVDNIYLYAAGMTAIYDCHRIVQTLAPHAKTIQLGFPYTDTLKIQQRFGHGVHFIDSVHEIEAILNHEPIAGVFCEIPSNPLLQTINLPALSALLHQHDIPLIIDDTIASWANVDLGAYADITATSLTKFFSGTGDVLAGSLCIHEQSPFATKLQQTLAQLYQDILYPDDVRALETNSRDFLERITQINATTEQLCDALQSHPAIEAIYYPKYVTPEQYQLIRKAEGGYGGLFSIIFKNPDQARRFYDILDVAKGPSLGTNFTLACPYTLLGHFNELDWAAQHGVPDHLVRVSVGLENAENLIERFNAALTNI